MVDFHWTFEAIGTRWEIDIHAFASEKHNDLKRTIAARIEAFDAAYSRFRSDSLVTEMSQRAGVYTLPDDAKPLLDIYIDFYRATAGKFTPLIGQVLADAGYDATYSFTSKELSAPRAFEDVVEYDFPTLTLSQPTLLDFGAAGKGYLVDLVSRLIEELAPGCKYLVDAGGDMRVHLSNAEPARIGLEHPDNTSQVIGIAAFANGAICGSAGNRRAWKSGEKEWHHIIDPVTLVSPRKVRAVWAISETALVADAVTTALYLVEPEQLAAGLADTYSYEFFILYDNGSFKLSSDFPAEIFTEARAV